MTQPNEGCSHFPLADSPISWEGKVYVDSFTSEYSGLSSRSRFTILRGCWYPMTESKWITLVPFGCRKTCQYEKSDAILLQKQRAGRLGRQWRLNLFPLKSMILHVTDWPDIQFSFLMVDLAKLIWDLGSENSTEEILSCVEAEFPSSTVPSSFEFFGATRASKKWSKSFIL